MINLKVETMRISLEELLLPPHLNQQRYFFLGFLHVQIFLLWFYLFFRQQRNSIPTAALPTNTTCCKMPTWALRSTYTRFFLRLFKACLFQSLINISSAPKLASLFCLVCRPDISNELQIISPSTYAYRGMMLSAVLFCSFLEMIPFQ